MKLQLNAIGNIPADYPAIWFRVSTYATESFVADYSTEAEAVKASYASTHGGRLDHKVATMRLSGH